MNNQSSILASILVGIAAGVAKDFSKTDTIDLWVYGKTSV